MTATSELHAQAERTGENGEQNRGRTLVCINHRRASRGIEGERWFVFNIEFNTNQRSAGSGHEYHSFHAPPLLRSNATILRLPFEL